MNTQKPIIQCFCTYTEDNTDYKGMFKTSLDGTKFVAFIRACHKCGKFRISLKKSDPKYDRPAGGSDYSKSTSPQPEAQKTAQQQMF